MAHHYESKNRNQKKLKQNKKKTIVFQPNPNLTRDSNLTRATSKLSKHSSSIVQKCQQLQFSQAESRIYNEPR